MKIHTLTFLLFTTFVAHSQTAHILPAPEGWGTEEISFPISFARSIQYKGTEELRFSPGWADSKTDEYWAYAFLWHLHGKPELTAEITEKNLTAYYTGLISVNTKGQKIPKEKLVPVKVSIKKTNTDDGDMETWSGTVDMMDYMSQSPLHLNCVVHIKSCPGSDDTFVFYQLSPKPVTDNVWISLRKLWADFKCGSGK